MDSQEPREGYAAVGVVVRPFGLDGEVKVESLTDFPDRFEPGERVWIAGQERTIAASRWQKGALYLKLAGVETIDQAEAIRDALLEVPESELRPLPEGDVYVHDLIGLTVQARTGEVLGKVAEVLHPGPNAVLVTRGDFGEVLVPFIEDVVVLVDTAAGRIEVDLIPGILPEPKAPPKPRRRYADRRARRANLTPNPSPTRGGE
jgi:16S rRNA processing protein RimM